MPRYSVKLYATPLAEVAFRTVEVEAPNAYRAGIAALSHPDAASAAGAGGVTLLGPLCGDPVFTGIGHVRAPLDETCIHCAAPMPRAEVA